MSLTCAKLTENWLVLYLKGSIWVLTLLLNQISSPRFLDSLNLSHTFLLIFQPRDTSAWAEDLSSIFLGYQMMPGAIV